MWLRTALLIFFVLLLFRFVTGIVQRLSPPEGRRPESDPLAEKNRPKSPDWKPSDVIDVPFREMPPEATESEKENVSARGGKS